ncbi:hypothetical protein BH23BAC3_BH23BAC3_18470 [soil metagenome]
MALLFMPAIIHGQSNSISLEEAVEMFKENSLQQELAKLEELRKKGEAVQYKSYFNPEVKVLREQLNHGTLDYEETTYQISQPLELLGQPFLRNRSASMLSEAAELEFAFDQQLLIRKVKILYAEYWVLTNKLQVYHEALQVIEDVLKSAEFRQSEGTISGTQVQRFSIERNRYLRSRNEVELNLKQVENELTSMILPPDAERLDITFDDSLTVTPLQSDQSSFVEAALSSRPDIQAMDRRSEASSLQYKVEKRERFPDLNIDFGYKTQSDGPKGFIIGGSVKLPIFNQNKGNITTAEANLRTAETSLQLQRQIIQNQVDAAYQRVQRTYEQWEAFQQQPVTRSMLRTAKSAYNEGRYSLIELLDATEAYVEGKNLQLQTVAEYNQALVNLEAMSSTDLF